MEEWAKDAQIDKTELGDESLNIPKLHHKYYTILVRAKLDLKKLDSEMKKLRLDKYEYYTQGASEEHLARGWKPLRKMIIKSETPIYMDGDEDIINLNLKIGYQHEKIEFLMDILKCIHNRNFQLKNALDWQKFIGGG